MKSREDGMILSLVGRGQIKDLLEFFFSKRKETNGQQLFEKKFSSNIRDIKIKLIISCLITELLTIRMTKSRAWHDGTHHKYQKSRAGCSSKVSTWLAQAKP